MKLLALKKSKPVVLIFIAALAAFLCLFIIRNKGSFAMAKPENRVVRVALPSKWKLPLYPASQHSMIEDAILANQFESLVKRGENGLILPSAAKAYKFNDDFTIYDFEIDQTRMFSDGSPVTADDFKRSWEEGLRLAQNSSNKNLNDMLSLAVGFDEFAQVGHIAGVEALSPSHLRIRFQKPFRMALMHLTGARFAAFKKDNETFIGTGKYIITPQQDESLQLSLNPHHKIDDGLDSIQIVYFDDPLPVLERGDIDLIAFYTKKVEGKENIKSTIGVEDASMWLYVNGLKGRIFADQELRLGFQSLVFRALKNCDEKIRKMPVNFKLDNQTFLPLQAGRLSSERANELVAKGDQYIDRLLDLSKKHPLKLAISDSFAFLREELRLQGLNFDNKTYPSFLDHLDEFYHKHENDAMFGGSSVHLSDPDGMYHILGRHGAITSPMIQRPRVAALFEEGRILLDQNEIPGHYQKAAEAVLEEVPAVHLGFVSQSYVYRSDRLQVDQRYLERHFDQFGKVFHLK